MATSNQPFPTRQIRRCIMPVGMLVSFLDRTTKELTDAKIHHVSVDAKTKLMFLYIETNVGEDGHTLPLDFDLNWEEVFGFVPCEITGFRTPVEEITVSRQAGKDLSDDLTRLGDFIMGKFKDREKEFQGQSIVSVAISLLGAL